MHGRFRASRAWQQCAFSSAVLFLLTACVDASLRGSALEPPKQLPAITIPATAGHAVSFTSGKPTLVFFGYTKCPDVCPTTLADWARVRSGLGERAGNVQFLFVSVDAERDTPEIARQYASRFDSAFIGVAPDSATTSALQKAFGTTSYREASSSAAGYLVAHSPQTFLVDGSGRLVAFYSLGAGWDVMLHDVETLL